MGSHEYHYGDRGQPERRPSRGFFFLGITMENPVSYYMPTEEGFEKKIMQRLDQLEKRKGSS